MSTGSPKLLVLYHACTKAVSVRAKIPNTGVLMFQPSDLKGEAFQCQVKCCRNYPTNIALDLFLVPGNSTLIDGFLPFTHGLLPCLISN